MESEERERVIAAYRASGGRRGEVSHVVAAGPLQVVLHTRYELRTHDVIFERAEGPVDYADVVRLPSVDPWSVEHEADIGAAKSIQRIRIDGSARVIECPPCGRTGSESCPICHGGGTVQSAGGPGGRARNETCGRCRGSGNVPCLTCEGRRYVRATPQVEIETGTHISTRVLESEELPVELLIQIGETHDDGKVIFEEEGDPIPMRARGSGYRGQANRVSAPVDAKIEELLSESLFDDRYEVHGQRLEVQQVPVYRLDLAGGHRGWAYGEPPLAWGEKRAILPWLAAGAAMIAAAIGAYFTLI